MGVHFHHTSFTVSDIAAAEKFFVDHFGMKRIGGGTYDFDYIRTVTGYNDAVLEIAFLSYPESGENLELIEYVKPKGEAGFDGDLPARSGSPEFQGRGYRGGLSALEGEGGAIQGSPVEITFGINKGSKAVYFNGPDGIALELIQPASAGTLAGV